MGTGKTMSCIKMMNRMESTRFIFVTPFLDEVERIRRDCSSRNFMTPEKVDGQKLNGLHHLLEKGSNIASTHSLFRRYNEETIRLIKKGKYHLVLDEVFSVAEYLDISKWDIELLLEQRIIFCENGRVVWNDRSNYDGVFLYLKPICESNNLFLSGYKMFYWLFPIKVFEAFEEVIILTYLFDAQVQKYYFDLYGVQYEKISVSKSYDFVKDGYIPDYVSHLHEKIHIVLDDKLNSIGEKKTSLSKSWFTQTKNKEVVGKLKNHVTNVFINRYQSPSAQNLWTTFKDSRTSISGNGYKRGFTPFTLRATNDYRNRTHLAYCVNVFMHPSLKVFFTGQGIIIDEDTYALSFMVQWVWRSAIRDGNEIWLYVPSKRMRTLFLRWLECLSRAP